MPPDPDAEDRRLLAAGDHHKLLAKYHDVIVARLKANAAPTGVIDDLAQEACVRLLKELRSGRRHTVKLRTIVNRITDWTLAAHRSGGRRELEFDPDIQVPVDDPGLEEAERRLDWEQLTAALPDRARTVIRMRVIEGMDISQIAEELGMTRNAVDQAIHRAVRQLHDQLAATR